MIKENEISNLNLQLTINDKENIIFPSESNESRLDTPSQQVLSSSHVEDNNPSPRFKPFVFKITTPFIPQSFDYKTNSMTNFANTNVNLNMNTNINLNINAMSNTYTHGSSEHAIKPCKNGSSKIVNPFEIKNMGKQISLKNPQRSSKNIVIVERSTLKKTQLKDQKNSVKLFIEENDIDVCDLGFRSNTIFENNEEDKSNTSYVGKSCFGVRDNLNNSNNITPLKEQKCRSVNVNIDDIQQFERRFVLAKEDNNNDNKSKIMMENNIDIINENEAHNITIIDPNQLDSNLDPNLDADPNNTKLLNGESNFNFDINQVRRYTRKEISKGKNFFKYRYISEMLLDSVELQNSNSNLSKVNPNNTCLNNNVYYSADNKNVIKFTCLFLQKIEKSIFLFNMKKYEESFTYLKESNIIRSEEEFGEILLVIQGFDKFIIGEFLSKEKSPNENFRITNYFIINMNFLNEFFLDSFRFLLSRMNLPKESGLILNIIDVFTNVYYNDNCTNADLFKDVTAVYLLASTILALNSMFHCKIPNANIKMMKKEEFVRMNKEVDKALSERIYDEIKENKLDIIYDYNEQIYRKHIELEDYLMRTLRKSNVNNGNNVNAFIKSDTGFNTGFNTGIIPEKNSVLNGEELINLLQTGQIFIKFGKSGEPHQRFVYLSKDEESLIWKPISCNLFSNERIIKTNSLVNVYIGTSNSQIFEKSKNKIPPEDELNCFSVLAKKRTLDLKHDNQKLCMKWYQALKYLIKRVISKSEIKNKKLKELSNRKEIISDFWRTQILPNWSDYRQFLLVNGQNHTFNNNDIYKKNISGNIKHVLDERRKSMNIDEKDKQDVAYLWFLGIPDWLRKKMWALVIPNNLEVNENLFNFFSLKNEVIEFNGESVIDKTNTTINVNTNTTNFNQIEETKILDMKTANPVIKEIIGDVNKSFKRFEEAIRNQNIEEKKFKEDLFKILRIFTNYRPDITYSRQIAYITTIFYLNSEDYYQAFILTSNIIISSFLTKFLIKEEIFIKTRCEFLETLLMTYTLSVYTHLKNLDISIRLFFYDWVEFLFTKTFKYETILRIWDCYLVKGEIFIYELSLSIIKLQEKDLINSTVQGILSNLYCFPDKYTEDDLFSEIEKIDITDEYKQLIDQDELAKEKTALYSAFLFY